MQNVIGGKMINIINNRTLTIRKRRPYIYGCMYEWIFVLGSILLSLLIQLRHTSCKNNNEKRGKQCWQTITDICLQMYILKRITSYLYQPGNIDEAKIYQRTNSRYMTDCLEVKIYFSFLIRIASSNFFPIVSYNDMYGIFGNSFMFGFFGWEKLSYIYV